MAMAAALTFTGARVDAQGQRGRGGEVGVGQGPAGRAPRALGAPRGTAFGGPMARGRGRGIARAGRGEGPLAGLGRLDLTDDQQVQLRAVVSNAAAERLAARTKTHEAILAILTPEQRAKLAAGPRK